MGQVINTFNIGQIIHGAAHTPIHLYIQRIIPWLEARQQAAKRLDHAITEEGRKNILEFMRQLDMELKNLLHILPPDKTKSDDNRSEDHVG